MTEDISFFDQVEEAKPNRSENCNNRLKRYEERSKDGSFDQIGVFVADLEIIIPIELVHLFLAMDS